MHLEEKAVERIPPKPIGTGTPGSSTPAPTASGNPTNCLPLGNIDCLGTVTSKDLAYLLFRMHSNDKKADLNNSGFVDEIDLRILLSNYGK